MDSLKENLYVKIDKMKSRINIETLLSAFGISNKKILQVLKEKEIAKKLTGINTTNVRKDLFKVNDMIIQKDSNIVW